MRDHTPLSEDALNIVLGLCDSQEFIDLFGTLMWNTNRTIDPLMYNLLYSLADNMREEFKRMEDISEQKTEREREREKIQERGKWVLAARGFYEIRWGMLVSDEDSWVSRQSRRTLDVEFTSYLRRLWSHVPEQIKCSLLAEVGWTSIRKRLKRFYKHL